MYEFKHTHGRALLRLVGDVYGVGRGWKEQRSLLEPSRGYRTSRRAEPDQYRCQ
jgi:hypothetical protein